MAVHKPPASSSKVAQAAAALADTQDRQKKTLRNVAQVTKLQIKTKVATGKSTSAIGVKKP
jgi:hypothetical protein